MRSWFFAALVVGLLFGVGSAAADSSGRKPSKKDRKAVEKAAAAFLECAKKKDVACLETKLEELKAKPQLACGELLGHLEAKKLEVHRWVARALVACKCKEGVDIAIDLLGLPDWEFKAELVTEFAPSKDKRLLEPVSKLVDKGRPFEREMGCKALGVLGIPEAIPVLVRATSHSMFSVRLEAARALGEFKDKRSTDTLCALVTNDSNAGVKKQSADSLAKLKDLQSVPCLAKGLNDRVGLVVTACHEALKAVTGVDVGIAPLAWEQWWDKNKPAKKRGRP